MTVKFFVHGEPVPKGSIKAFIPKGWTRPVLTSTSGPKLKSWANSVATVASQHQTKFDGPVEVKLVFFLNRPKSVSIKKRPMPITKPDLDKLVRAALDPLIGIVFCDDAQIVEIEATKQYADYTPPGCEFEIGDVLKLVEEGK